MQCISCSVYVNINYLSLRINLRKILRLLVKTFFKRSTKGLFAFWIETRKLACFRYHMKYVSIINIDKEEDKLFPSRIVFRNRSSSLQNLEIHSLVKSFYAEYCTDLVFLKGFHIIKEYHFHFMKIYRLTMNLQ